MADEYKNFNEYEKSVPDENPPTGWAPGHEEKASAPQTAAPDPNPPTGWAPGYSEGSTPAVSKSSPMGITSILLSLLGYCFYGIPSIVGIFLGAKAYKRNKSDVTAKIGLTACILMVIFWAAYIAYLLFTPAGQEALREILDAANEMMNEYYELYSATDIYSMFR